jgi:hypothetical protein
MKEKSKKINIKAIEQFKKNLILYLNKIIIQLFHKIFQNVGEIIDCLYGVRI